MQICLHTRLITHAHTHTHTHTHKHTATHIHTQQSSNTHVQPPMPANESIFTDVMPLLFKLRGEFVSLPLPL